MMKLKYLLKCLVVLVLQLMCVQAHPHDLSSPESELLKQEGQFFSIRIVRGEPLRIFIVGREEAKLDLSELKLTVRRVEPYAAQSLKVTKQGDFYAVPEAHDPNETTDLELKTRLRDREETFRFKIKSARP